MREPDELSDECKRDVAKQLLRREAKCSSSTSTFCRTFNFTLTKNQQSAPSADESRSINMMINPSSVSRRQSGSRAKDKESSKRPKSSRTLCSIHEPLNDFRPTKEFFPAMPSRPQQPQQPEIKQQPAFPETTEVATEPPATSSNCVP